MVMRMGMIYVPGLAWDKVTEYQHLHDPFINTSVTQLNNKGNTLVESGAMHRLAPVAPVAIPPKARDILFGGTRLVDTGRPKVPIKIPVKPEETDGIGSLSCVRDQYYYASVSNICEGPLENKGLADLGAKDILYIVGHGGVYNHIISYKKYINCDFTTRKICGQDGSCRLEQILFLNIDAILLAKMLKLDGLKKKHKNISLIMCFGGGVEYGTLKSQIPFSQALKRAMVSLGFSKKINIGGSHGLVIWDGTDLKVRKMMKMMKGPPRILIKRGSETIKM
jgi:hypothetical protein